jgi:sigma-B regulation protein RsbU (phosphoserine phosphatase)
MTWQTQLLKQRNSGNLMPLIHSFSHSPNDKAARYFRNALSPVLSKVGLNSDDSNKFLLAMSEAVTNVQKHACPPAELVSISFHRSRAQWRLEISDDGPPFFAFNDSAGLENIENLSEGGRGLYLIQSQFPDFKYEPKTDSVKIWNTLTLSIPLQTSEYDRPKAAIIDDDPVFVDVISAYLKDTFLVVSFENATSALESLTDSPVDLVISDIRMPEMDGYTFRRKLKNSQTMETVPFIFLTGSDSPSNREQAANLSIDDYLTKPIDKHQLNSTIHRVMKRASDLKNSLGDRLDDEITEALHPHFSTHPIGYNTAISFEAASAGGGDILIEHKLDHGHLIILADIMGHGEQAKFFAHAFSGYVYGAMRALGRCASPKVILNELSDMFLTDRLLKRSFATALALILYPDGKISVAAAGHPPPFVMSANGLISINVSGPLLGLMDRPEYIETQFELATNDRLVLLTDGISEAGKTMVSHPGDFFESSAAEISDCGDQEISDKLLSYARAMSDYVLLDDATAVVVRKSNDK